MMNRKKRSQGFSLIELLIVVTIILILAAIAIPKLLTVKQQANSTAAVANTKSLLNALTAYASQYTAIGYPSALANLGGAAGAAPTATGAELVDNTLVTAANVQGYTFAYVPVGNAPVPQFTLNTDPVSAAYGQRHFFTDESDVIRYKDSGTAKVSDPPIGQ